MPQMCPPPSQRSGSLHSHQQARRDRLRCAVEQAREKLGHGKKVRENHGCDQEDWRVTLYSHLEESAGYVTTPRREQSAACRH